MQRSEQLDSLAKALSKAQGELEPAIKDSKANYGKYADLSSVWEACRATLAKHGLSVAQGLTTNGPDGALWTMLMHESGQFICGECPLILGKRDPQGVGAAMTYYRRYGLAAILGITQEDDDAQSAMPRKEQPSKPAPVADVSAASEQSADYAATLDEATDVADLMRRYEKVPKAYHPALTKKMLELKRKLGVK